MSKARFDRETTIFERFHTALSVQAAQHLIQQYSNAVVFSFILLLEGCALRNTLVYDGDGVPRILLHR